MNEKLYMDAISQADMLALKKFKLQLQVYVTVFYLKLKSEGTEPNETCLKDQFKSEELKL